MKKFPLKMGDLKEISRKEFETYLRVKEFIERNGYQEADLRKMVRDRKPTRIPLMIRSDDMEPKRCECYWMQLMTSKFQSKLSYMHMRIEGHLLSGGKMELKFSILNGSDYNTYLTEISITTSERSQEATRYPQVSTSALLSQRLSQVHLLGSTSHDYQSFSQFLSICKSF